MRVLVHSFLFASLLTPVATAAQAIEDNALAIQDRELAQMAPVLRRRILATPYNYFRYIHVPFAEAACQRFANRMAEFPVVDLHGDAHLEQFMATAESYGLGDFDTAMRGPVVLDLVRFSASLFLAARHRGQFAQARNLVAGFVSAYFQAMRNPTPLGPPPAVVYRLRQQLPTAPERVTLLQGLIQPLPAPQESAVLAGYSGWVTSLMMARTTPSRSFLRVVSVGSIRLGIASFSRAVFLIRIAGPSDAPGDDEFVELKPLLSPRGISCAEQTLNPGQQVLRAERVFSMAKPALPGATRVADQPYWGHLWPHTYAELDLEEHQLSIQELRELAEFAAWQLAHGHRQSGLRGLESTLESLLVDGSIELGQRVEAAWRFQSEQTASHTRMFPSFR